MVKLVILLFSIAHMDLFLQLWGGIFYLTNKVLFAFSVTTLANTQRLLKMLAWTAYLIGVPAWIVILLGKDNWIAASVEVGGIPAMLLGLYNTYHHNLRVNKLFNFIVSSCTYAALFFGLAYSFVLHGGITMVTQWLELGVMLGFLMGGYMMAKNHVSGWLFFMLMNMSMAALMLLQEKWILMAQQLLSLGFVVYGYSHARKQL